MARRKKLSDEQSSENTDNIHQESDDNFGLPEVEYEPLNRDTSTPKEEPAASTHTSYSSQQEETIEPEYVEPVSGHDEEVLDEDPAYAPVHTYEEDEPAPVWPKVLITLLILVVVGGGAYWYFGIERPRQQAAEAAAQAEADKRAADKRAADLAAAQAAQREEDERRRADSLANLAPKEGSVEALTDRTGRYYVVVASAIDDDLIMDYAQKLSKNGVVCRIIPPFGKTQFSRLAVDVKDTYADAQATADGMKGGDYGNEIWVVRY
ncbi:DUF4366 domain-containing protein [Dawidia soli]|uniref:SPOR domain-containing protein n=1 Tax=Dawidia soli TaxID=2782352 RepID=A0AAP2GCT8_9BACT|nr:DUF4366 domain-containing protein [Dawidia soli]MBT1686497.1 hypothetical protein [Dawidia soli]